MGEPRTAAQRKADALAALSERHADVWVASASGDDCHLVPLSFSWTGTQVILATEVRSVTMRNVVASSRARLGFGVTRNVVMVDATLDEAIAVVDVPPAVADAYSGQADWDPRTAAGDFAYLLFRPHRIQVWKEADEIEGRTVMRRGAWTV